MDDAPDASPNNSAENHQPGSAPVPAPPADNKAASSPPKARRAATVVLLFCLGVSVLFLTWICAEILMGMIRGDRGSGRIALLVFQNETLRVVLKSAVAILAFGAAVIAEAKNRVLIYYIVVALSVVGVIECIGIAIGFTDYDVASLLYDYPGGSAITSYEKLQNATQLAMGGLGFWFLGVLSTQFGLKLPPIGGAGS